MSIGRRLSHSRLNGQPNRRRARVVFTVLAVLSISSLSPIVVAPTASAACAESVQATRAVSFTGTAIETLPYDDSQSLLRWTFKSPDGTEREVRALGAAPDNPDWPVEDAFAGPLPVIGRTYTIDGWTYGPSEPILLNACKPNTVVDVTDTVDTTRSPASQESPPDSSVSTTTTASQSSRSTLEVAGIVLLGIVAALGIWSVWRIRRRRATGLG